jgi:hypothetical protein
MADQERDEPIRRLEEEVNQRAREAFSGLREQLAERLRRMSDDAVAELADLVPETPPSFLRADEITPLAEEAGRAAGRRAVGELVGALSAIDRARTQGAILDALAREGGRFASRTAVLLTRSGGAEVWSAHGWERGMGELALSYPDSGAWSPGSFGRATTALAGADCADLCGAADEPLPEEGLLVPLVLRDRLAAVVYADRLEGGSLVTEAVQMLTWAASQALESLPFRDRAATATLLGPDDGVAEPLELWGSPEAAGGGPSEAAAVGFGAAGMAAAHRDAEEEAEEPDEETQVFGEVEPVEADAALEAEPGAGEVGDAEGGADVEAPDREVSADFAAADAAAEEIAVAEPFPEVEPAADAVLAEDEGVGWTLDEAPDPAPEPEAEGPAEEELAAPFDAEDDEAWPAVSGEEVGGDEMAAAEPAGGSADAFAAEPWSEAPEEVPVAAADEEATEPSGTEDGVELEDGPGEEREALYGTVEAPLGTLPALPVEAAGLAASAVEEAPENDAGSETVDSVPPPVAAPAEGGRFGPEVVPPPDVAGPGSAFAGRAGGASGEEVSRHEEARRLARLLVSEIRLYNEDEVEAGRRNGDIYDRLKEDIDRSRQMYEERVDPAVRESTDYFLQELVRNLGGGDARALGM